MALGLDAFDFHVPDHLIAQHPLPSREDARLMCLRRGAAGCSHRQFHDLPSLLPADSLLVVNNTKVQARRLAARLEGGTPIEALLLEEEAPGVWRAMVKRARRIKPGQVLPFAEGRLAAKAVARTEDGCWRLAFEDPASLPGRLALHGLPPLPPYIRRDIHGSYDPARDRADYQTRFARVEGAVAAPTAGLHFTEALLERLKEQGTETVELTLHVGEGTFAKIQGSDPSAHPMHREWCEVGPDAARRLREAREHGRPIIAVGTTSVRTLETWAGRGMPESMQCWSELFVHPPYDFLAVDGMITNFHQPRTTLVLMVAAFHGRENLLAAYGEAVARGYRFFSFGDGMLILPESRG